MSLLSITKRRLSVGIAATLLLACATAHAQTALDDILRTKVLKVGVQTDSAPYGYVGTDLKPIGLDVDMANYIGAKLGVKVELVPVTSANRIPYLQTRKVDLVISSLGRNAERDKVIDFSTAYAPFFNGVFGPADQKVAKADDLAGKSVGVTRGAVEDLELSKIAPPSASIKRFEDNNGTISAFLSGQVDLVATGNVVAAAILARNPPKKPEVKFLIKDSPCFIGLNKNEPKLLAAVNQAIEAATELGVDEVIPWQADRSIVQWRGERGEKARRKWDQVLLAATKQSRRARRPVTEKARSDQEGQAGRVGNRT